MGEYKCTVCKATVTCPDMPEDVVKTCPDMFPGFCPNCIKDSPDSGTVESLKKYNTLVPLEE